MQRAVVAADEDEAVGADGGGAVDVAAEDVAALSNHLETRAAWGKEVMANLRNVRALFAAPCESTNAADCAPAALALRPACARKARNFMPNDSATELSAAQTSASFG